MARMAASVALFELGKIYSTPGVERKVSQEEALISLGRHVSGDWGNVGVQDWKENDFALRNDCRILSTYVGGESVTYWIITEADRSATTILLPDEY